MHLALAALGVGPGDAVIASPMTFCSGVHVIEQVGALPVLVDVEPDTLNLDPAKVAESIEKVQAVEAVNVKAILPVHLYGHPCDLDNLLDIATEYELALVEDAAHSLPTKYKRGRRISVWFPSEGSENGVRSIRSICYASLRGGTDHSSWITRDRSHLAFNNQGRKLHTPTRSVFDQHDSCGGALRDDDPVADVDRPDKSSTILLPCGITAGIHEVNFPPISKRQTSGKHAQNLADKW